jgi:hypothetical protein
MAVLNSFSYLILPRTVFGVVREKSLQKYVSWPFHNFLSTGNNWRTAEWISIKYGVGKFC